MVCRECRRYDLLSSKGKTWWAQIERYGAHLRLFGSGPAALGGGFLQGVKMVKCEVLEPGGVGNTAEVVDDGVLDGGDSLSGLSFSLSRSRLTTITVSGAVDTAGPVGVFCDTSPPESVWSMPAEHLLRIIPIKTEGPAEFVTISSTGMDTQVAVWTGTGSGDLQSCHTVPGKYIGGGINNNEINDNVITVTTYTGTFHFNVGNQTPQQ